jgi:hypothetical protein
MGNPARPSDAGFLFSRVRLKGLRAQQHSPDMKAFWLLPLVAICALADEAADRTAIRRAIELFNDPQERASVLAPDADIPSSRRCWATGRSPIYFEMKGVRFIGPDVALADATATQYSSVILKQNMPAVFILKRQGRAWLIDALRVLENCVTLVPLTSEP